MKLSSRKGARNTLKFKRNGHRIQLILAITFCVFILFNIIYIIPFLFHLNTNNDNNTKNQNNHHPIISPSKHKEEKQSIQNLKHELLYSSWHYPYIHLVNTRFMQDQPHLINLAEARIHLFETFCLPSMILQATDEKNPPQLDSFTREAFRIQQKMIHENNHNNGKDHLKSREEEWSQVEQFLHIQNFLWIIKTDPNLHPKIIEKLVELLRPYPNFFLVGSNINYGVGSKPGGWRDGQAGESVLSLESTTTTTSSAYNGNHHNDTSMIYTGDLRLLRLAHEFREDRVIIETRLDADDGIHKNYLKMIQNKAMNTVGRANIDNIVDNQHIKWIYWCATDHLEWFSKSEQPLPLSNITNTSPITTKVTSNPGILHRPEVQRDECITPGISLAIAIDVQEEEIQRFSHQLLVQKIRMKGNCGYKTKGDCLQFIQTMDINGKEDLDESNPAMELPTMMAIRARTPTSAGMKNVVVMKSNTLSDVESSKHDQNKKMETELDSSNLWWDKLKSEFGISKENLEHTNGFIQQNLKEIAIDNIKGQGTDGHSSKISSKDKLQALVDVFMGDERLVDHNEMIT